MSAIDCVREQELLDALASSRWPGRCDTGLRDHVAECAVCRDTLAVALPLLHDGEAAFAGAQVPSSGVVWWRAQLRARREAERAASRPITIVQAIAFCCGAVSMAALALWASPALPNWRDWLRGLGHAAGAAAVELGHAAAWGVLPWLILGMWIVLIPLAIYLAVADE
jgi:hypothetical protein